MPIPILQGTLDLMILRTLATMGPQHAYGIANRLQQVSEDALNLNQGTIYPALVRIEQHGWTRGSWGKTENSREAKYYTITRAGLKALNEETKRWRQMAGVFKKLLAEEQKTWRIGEESSPSSAVSSPTSAPKRTWRAKSHRTSPYSLTTS